jgi:GNAT superfamily N-acetyltransferase
MLPAAEGPVVEWQRGLDLISTDRNRLDLDVIHGFLVTSSWSPGITRQLVQRAIENSVPFGLYREGAQIGFARVTTDYTTFAYLADVFVLEAFRGQGLGRWVSEAALEHPALQGLRRWLLATSTAPWLYEKIGFRPLVKPAIFMERHDPHVYTRARERERK